MTQTTRLIANDLIITNHHCIPGRGNVTDAMLWMGYLTPRSRASVAQYRVEIQPVESDEALDYSILRINGAPGHEWGVVSLSADIPGDAQSLFIFHHPGGFAQHVSRGRCQTSAPAIDGDDLMHICDTLPGSSGAPIFDNNTRKVIGLHFSAVALNKINAGKKITSIAKRSPLIAGALGQRANVAHVATEPHFDGLWDVNIIERVNCKAKGKATFRVEITNGKLSGDRGLNGQVDSNGLVRFQRLNNARDNFLHFEIQLDGGAGEGRFKIPQLACNGIATMVKNLP